MKLYRNLLTGALLAVIFVLLAASKSSAQESATLDGGAGGFIEMQGYEEVQPGLPNSISYGISFTITGNKIRGTAQSSELQAGGNVINQSLTLRGKVRMFTVSKLIPSDGYLFYKKAQGVFAFTLSDGTVFSGTVKGKIDLINTGYQVNMNGTFKRSGFQDLPQTFSNQMHVTSGTYSW